MSSQDARAFASIPRSVPDVLDALVQQASTVLLDHRAADGWCQCCGGVWPCEHALRAAHNLALR